MTMITLEVEFRFTMNTLPEKNDSNFSFLLKFTRNEFNIYDEMFCLSRVFRSNILNRRALAFLK